MSLGYFAASKEFNGELTNVSIVVHLFSRKNKDDIFNLSVEKSFSNVPILHKFDFSPKKGRYFK